MLENILNIKNQLIRSKKQKLVCISTTANVNNQAVIFGSIRETETTIAGNIILRNLDVIDLIINELDGFVDYFLIDSEVKNEIKNLQNILVSKIKKSKYLVYKPNDFTINSLDMFIAVKSPNIIDKKILILGCGNIGSKIAITLCERDAFVYIYDIDFEKTEKIVEGLNLFVKSNKKIEVLTKLEFDFNFDIVLGCTNGKQIISELIASKTNDYIIDVGNTNLTYNGILKAKELNIPIYVLSSISGYNGMIINWLITQKNINNFGFLKISNKNSLITIGMLGAKGDIIVDNVLNPSKIIGICDGNGDILYDKLADNEINNIVENENNKEILNQIKKLYYNKN